MAFLLIFARPECRNAVIMAKAVDSLSISWKRGDKLVTSVAMTDENADALWSLLDSTLMERGFFVSHTESGMERTISLKEFSFEKQGLYGMYYMKFSVDNEIFSFKYQCQMGMERDKTKRSLKMKDFALNFLLIGAVSYLLFFVIH